MGLSAFFQFSKILEKKSILDHFFLAVHFKEKPQATSAGRWRVWWVGCLLGASGCSGTAVRSWTYSSWRSEQRQRAREGTGERVRVQLGGLAAGQGNGIGELRRLVVVVFGCVRVSGQHKLPHIPPPPCPASPSCSLSLCCGCHTSSPPYTSLSCCRLPS